MNKKTMTISLIALGVLLVLFCIQKNITTKPTDIDSLSDLSIEFDNTAVAKIDVFKRDFPDSGLHFLKTDQDKWVLTNAFNAPAKEGDISLLLTDLSDVTGSIRGDSEELYPDFKIADDQALWIELYDNADNMLAQLFVGKGGTSGQQCFVRLPDFPIVYLAEANFISRFAAWEAEPDKKLPNDRWIELTLNGMKREDITGFKITAGNKTYEFAYVPEETQDTLLLETKKKWVFANPKSGLEIEESNINSLASRMGALNATGIADPVYKNQFGLDKPEYSIWISDTNGYARNIHFSKPFNDDGDRYVVTEIFNGVFTVKKYLFESIFVKPFEKKK